MLKIGYLTVEEIETMRKQNKTWRTIADFCGVSHGNFYKWKRRYGISDNQIMRDTTKFQPAPKKEKAIARIHELGFETISDFIRHQRQRGITREQMAKEINVSKSFITRHAPDDVKWYRHESWNKNAENNLSNYWKGRERSLKN